MDTVGTFEMAKVLEKYKCSVTLHKFYQNKELLDFFESKDVDDYHYRSQHWISIGITECDLQKLDDLAKYRFIDYLCVDVANGYQESFVDTVKNLRDNYPKTVIMAGNVVTGDMTEALILAGADVVKVGVGSGASCTTRKMTGVGFPQLSAIIDCADAAHGLKGLICADGGITVPGDLVKAFGAGADFVMMGGMFAAHDESGGEIIEKDGRKYKQFYGMSSETAQLKYYGEKRNYRASEGRTLELPCRGPVSQTLEEILGGLRSAMTYIGAKTLKEVSKRTTFVRVNKQFNDIFVK